MTSSVAAAVQCFTKQPETLTNDFVVNPYVPKLDSSA
jgi:hypothetical protein